MVIAEWFELHQGGETVPQYTAELQKLVEHCNLDGALRDQFVCGSQKRKLLTEGDLNLMKAFKGWKWQATIIAK